MTEIIGRMCASAQSVSDRVRIIPAIPSASSRIRKNSIRQPDSRKSGMITRTRASALIFSLAALFAGPSPAAEDVALLKDLTSVIMLLGLPCGEVVSARRQADNDHIATCKDGNRYRVFVNAAGRVVAQKQ